MHIYQKTSTRLYYEICLIIPGHFIFVFEFSLDRLAVSPLKLAQLNICTYNRMKHILNQNVKSKIK